MMEHMVLSCSPLHRPDVFAFVPGVCRLWGTTARLAWGWAPRRRLEPEKDATDERGRLFSSTPRTREWFAAIRSILRCRIWRVLLEWLEWFTTWICCLGYSHSPWHPIHAAEGVGEPGHLDLHRLCWAAEQSNLLAERAVEPARTFDEINVSEARNGFLRSLSCIN